MMLSPTLVLITSSKSAIAKSNAQREIAVAEAENAKASNDARVKAKEEIAKRNNSLAIQKAQLKQEADAAMEIEAENQRKLRDVAAANADIARQEKEIDLKEREVTIKERALEAAEAKKYAAQQDADAKLYAIQKQSEADLYERQKTAEAVRRSRQDGSPQAVWQHYQECRSGF